MTPWFTDCRRTRTAQIPPPFASVGPKRTTEPFRALGSEERVSLVWDRSVDPWVHDVESTSRQQTDRGGRRIGELHQFIDFTFRDWLLEVTRNHDKNVYNSLCKCHLICYEYLQRAELGRRSSAQLVAKLIVPLCLSRRTDAWKPLKSCRSESDVGSLLGQKETK